MTDHEELDRWREIDAVFARVLDRPPDERLTYLVGLRDIDASLRAAVERLLEAHREAETFLETPLILSPESLDGIAANLGRSRRLSGPGLDTGASGDHAETEPEPPAASPGERIGAWRVVEELGRGGMATVYLVERADGRYAQKAALKLLRRGLDTADVVRRFRAERQILSTLAHPHISQLLDGGATEDGRPYLVMEQVEGMPITRWCDARNASVEDRLPLFVDVARAVHYAHTKLIIHRDLKPSNILVTVEGGVKLLDFGIAKILDPNLAPDDGPRTRTGHRALTPDYASPEQMRGEPVTTATDVYQLGLLLHRLLTGARPGDARGPSSRLLEEPTPTPTAPSRLARRMEPEMAEARASTPERLSRRFHGDLDSIVLTALETDPERRYGSALGMAEDVERHLAGLPITARTAGRLYRLGKFAGRHRWVVPALVAAALIGAVYVGTLVRHGQRLEVERNTALREAERAEHVRDVLLGVFQSADPWSADEPRNVTEAGMMAALDIGTERASAELSEDPELRAELFSAIAEAYVGLGDVRRAETLLEQAVEIQRELHGADSRQAALASLRLGHVYNRSTRYDAGVAVLRPSLAAFRRLATTPDSVLVSAMFELGYAEKGLGRHAEAERLLLEASEVLDGLDDPPPDLRVRVDQDLALLYAKQDRPEEARALARRAHESRRRRYGDDHLMTADARSSLAVILWHTTHGDFGEAAALQEESARAFDALLGADHPRSIGAWVLLAEIMRSDGRLDDAETHLRSAMERSGRVYGEESPRHASILGHLAGLLYNAGKLEEADGAAARVQRILEGSENSSGGLTSILVIRCGIDLHSGAFRTAEERCRRASEILRDDGFSERNAVVIAADCRLGAALELQGRSSEAAAVFDRVLAAVWESRTLHKPGDVHHCLSQAAAAYEAIGRGAEAGEARERAAGMSRRGLPGVARD